MESEKTLRNLRNKLKRRIRLGELLSSLTLWVSGSLFIWGTLILLARIFSPSLLYLAPYGGGIVAGAVGIALLVSSWKKFADSDVTALLDQQIDGKNLLVSIEETGSTDSTWKERVLQKARKGSLQVPSLNWSPLLRSVGPALLFLVLSWFTPLPEFRNSINSPGNALVKEKVKDLRKKINMVEEEHLMKKKDTRQLKKKLKELEQADFSRHKKKDNPWSVLDSVEKKVNRSLKESSRAISRARLAANRFSQSRNKKAKPKSRTRNRGNSKNGKGMKTPGGGQNQSGKNDGKMNGKNNRSNQKALSAAIQNLKKTGLKNDPALKKLLKQMKSGNGGKQFKGKNLSGQQAKNWKKLKKQAKKLAGQLNKKHARMHKKGMCKGGL